MDILLLLPVDHSANVSVKLLFKKFPKFRVNTPVPFYASELPKLHKQNITNVENYLFRNNLPVPPSFTHLTLHHFKPSRIADQIIPCMKTTHPFQRLKHLLQVFHLTIIPADKTSTLTILPTRTLEMELNEHLKDQETYRLLKETEVVAYNKHQSNAAIEAAIFYKASKIVINNPSPRYIYFLPKVHKENSQWRSKFHPKMRPIISDTNSITHQLAKHLLPQLQVIERSFDSTVTSSLAVTHNIKLLNRNLEITKDTILATVDVESLFTKIPQERLLDIVNHLLTETTEISQEHKLKFMQYIQIIIQCNTFQVYDDTYLQQIGLPMGGPLSGTLANIYLGFLEKDVYQMPKLTMYNRYMDDLLIIANLTPNELQQCIKQLKATFQLTLTMAFNKTSVNFLDMTITINRTKNCFETGPYTKNYVHYPIPSSLEKEQFGKHVNIITSQLLRTWRLSSNGDEYTKSVNHYLHFLTSNRYHKRLRKKVFHFLKPVKVSTHKWTTSVPLCRDCEHVVMNSNINITKITIIDKHYIATKKPCNCNTENIHIIVKYEDKETLLQYTSSLHEHLASESNLTSVVEITPLGHISPASLQRLVEKHRKFHPPDKQKTKSILQPCYINNIFKKPYAMYGVSTQSRRRKTVGTLLNFYKKIGRKKPK